MAPTSRRAPTASAGAAPAGAPAPERAGAWFASDFHLHGDDPDGVERACAFVRAAGRARVAVLGLLGDVFRAWLGPPSLDDPGLAPFLRELAALTDAGTRVLLVHGNHDFALGPEFARATGAEVHAAGTEVRLGGERVRLEHGDAFCTRDRGYHRLHRLLRSRPARALFAGLPRTALEAIAGGLLGSASRTTSAKPASVMDIVDDAVAARLATGLDAVICGHVHRAREARLPLPGGGSGRLFVLADFERSGSHLVWERGRFVLHAGAPRFAPPLPPVLAIDGPAGSGKSSVGKRVAERLGWLRLDSGALYRAVTARALEAGVVDDPAALGRLARALDLRVEADGGVSVDGARVPDARLRDADVSAHVSAVSAVPAVRAALLGVQRDARLGRAGLVAEGRDMATVVFPRATHRVWLDAAPEERARRRLAQNPGEGRSLEEVARALAARDARDRGRATAPLRRADDAWVLDTTALDLEQVVARVLERVEGAAGG